ncbi:hypothetical protein EKK58_10155 [Candidatus Dependentiae bacterium]|nr:MAG: hypothetical protein EKK58_10155 [Candidatus Dependentiae bacterium]
MNYQLNQFGLTNELGAAMNVNPSTISVKISKDFAGLAADGTAIYTGYALKFVASEASDMPVMTEAASADQADAVVLFNAKKAAYEANDIVEVALVGSIVTMQAGTAMNRRQLVSWNNVSHKIQATTTNYLGYTLDIASATGDIVRVLIQPKMA